MAISRMQQPRQMYGLGSIVKKAVRGVKKIVKSPIGKAALIAGGGALAGSFMAGGTGAGLGRFSLANLGNFGRGALSSFGSKGKLSGIGNMFRQDGKAGNPLSYGRLGLGALGVASLAPLLMKGGGDDEEETVVEQIDPAAQVQRAKNYYSGLGDKGVGLNFMPKKKYVSQNFYAADGGRAGYAMGGNIDEDDEDYIRSAAGQSRRQPTAFLNMGGGAGEAQAEQMLMAEFIKYKNKGGDLSFEQFVKAVMQQQEQAQGMEQPMMAANGGRIGYGNGGDPLTEFEIYRLGQMGYDVAGKGVEPFGGLKVLRDILNVNSFADGGMAGMSVPGYGTPAGTNKFGYPSGGT